MTTLHHSIKSFWDERAHKFTTNPQATFGEMPLRRLEISTVVKFLKRYRPRLVLDVGCGNGYSTAYYASKFPATSFVGVDYSEAMINNAQTRRLPNCKFAVANVLDPSSFPAESFDIVLTQRCIQNLPDYPAQRAAIENLWQRRPPTGWFG